MEDVKANMNLSALKGEAGNACTRIGGSPEFVPGLLAMMLVWEFGALLFEASQNSFLE